MSATIKKITVKQQIACVEREIKQREKVYPGLVFSRRMRQVEADWQIQAMKAVLSTLQWLQANKDDIQAFMHERKVS